MPRTHALFSLVLSVVLYFYLDHYNPALWVILGVASGVLVDVDHALVAFILYPKESVKTVRRVDVDGFMKLMLNEVEWYRKDVPYIVKCFNYFGWHVATVFTFAISSRLLNFYPEIIVPNVFGHLFLDVICVLQRYVK